MPQDIPVVFVYRLFFTQVKQVEEYMAYRKLPRETRQRITEYFEHRYQVAFNLLNTIVK